MRLFNKMQLVTMISLMIVISSCAPRRYISDPDSGMYTLAEYQDTLNLWVTHDEVHKELIGVADVHALYKSWEVRQAYLDALNQRANLSSEELESKKEREIKQFRNGHEFLIGLYCYKKDWYKVTGQDPVWRLTLSSSNGSKVRPFLIEEVTVDSDKAWQYLDFMVHARKTYRVVFPNLTDDDQEVIGPDIEWFSVSLHSLLGTLECKWDIGPIPVELK